MDHCLWQLHRTPSCLIFSGVISYVEEVFLRGWRHADEGVRWKISAFLFPCTEHSLEKETELKENVIDLSSTLTPMTHNIIFNVCGHVSVPGPDRGGEGEGERLHIDPGGRTGELQGSGRAVEDAAGGHHTGVSIYKSYVCVIMFFVSPHIQWWQMTLTNINNDHICEPVQSAEMTRKTEILWLCADMAPFPTTSIWINCDLGIRILYLFQYLTSKD